MHWRICVLMIAATFLLPSPVRADAMRQVEEEAEAARRAVNVHFDIAQTLAFRSDVRSGGDVSVARTRLEVALQGDVADGATLGFGVVFEPTFYRFRNAPRLVPGTNDPVDDVYLVRFGPTLTMRINDSWSWFVGAHLRFAGESGADVEDAFTFSGFGGATQRVNENFTYSVGLYVVDRMEDDPLVLPLITLNWRIDERMRLTSRGTGLRLGYTLDPAWELGVFGSYEWREYRLDDNRSDLPSGVLIEQAVPVGVDVVWRPHARIDVALEGGVLAYREFETLNRSGRNVHDTRTDPAAFIELRARIRF